MTTSARAQKFLFDGYTFDQEKQFKKRRSDLSYLQAKSDQAEPVRVPQYERD